MDFKNNGKLLGISIVMIFSCIVIFNELRRNNIKNRIRQNKATTVGKTIGCINNIKSSLHTLQYLFIYKDIQYSGREQFDKNKRGDICNDRSFLIEFDSLNPENNRIILDSVR